MGATRTRRRSWGSPAGRPDPSGKQRKTLNSRVKQVGERTLRFTISTGDVDRDGDTINPQGWLLENFLLNPVVLFGHRYADPAIGQCTSIGVEGDALVADAQFADAETYAFADTIFRLYAGGYMRAVSVGFLPKRWEIVEDDSRPYGIDFIEQELLEFSCVSVPSNPYSLVQARSAGVDVSQLEAWARGVLRSPGGSTAGEGSLQVDRDRLEQIVEEELRGALGLPQRSILDGIPPERIAEIVGEEFDHALRRARGRIT